MARRFSYSRRRMALESLEVRCNPSAMDPGTSIIIEPPTAGELVEIGEIAPNQRRADGARTNVEVFVTVTDTETSAGGPDNRGVADVSLNGFAGQTLRVRIASTNNQSKLIVGVDDVRLTAGIGLDPRQGGASTGRLFVATNVGVFVDISGGRGGDDVLVGGVGLDPASIGHTRLLIGDDVGICNAPSGNDTGGHGTHVAGTIGAEGNNRAGGST